MLEAEAGGVKGEDQEYPILVPSVAGGARAKLREILERWVRAPSMTAGENPAH